MAQVDNVVVVLVDSLNSRHLSVYGNQEIKTPNFDRLAEKACVFENHFISSAPCMPARRELMTGRREFLRRPWGPMEPFDQHIATKAKELGAVTAMVTDHFHYWEHGAHGYMESFEGLEMIRGHEIDYWRTDHIPEEKQPDWVKSMRRYNDWKGLQYYKNVREFGDDEEQFFAPKVMKAACEWLDQNHQHDRFLLWVESFDVHEPFHVPEPYRSMYTDNVSDDYTCWPPYQVGEHGHVPEFWENTTPEEIDYIRGQYMGKVTMVDKWFGKLLDKMDELELWKNTMVIVTADHGHELGEKERYGKPYPHYDLNAHIPLLVYHPDFAHGERKSALTSTLDIYPTLLDAMGAEDVCAPDGQSIMPVLRGETDTHREHVLYGTFGCGATITTPEYTYAQGYDSSRAPLHIYTATLPALPGAKQAVGGHFLRDVELPVWKVPVSRRDRGDSYLFDRAKDPSQDHNLVDSEPELAAKMQKLLKEVLEKEDCPPEQFARLGLS